MQKVSACLLVIVLGCTGPDARELPIAARDSLTRDSWIAAPRLSPVRSEMLCGESFARSCAFGWAQGQPLVLRDGRLVFSDRRQGVVAIDARGRPATTFGGIGTREGEYFHVADVAAAQDGGVVIVDDLENVLLVFDSSGHLSSKQGIPGAKEPRSPWRGDSVVAIAADAHGIWLVTVAPGDRMGAPKPGRLWRVRTASGIRQVGSVPVNTVRVGKDDMQPPEPLLAQKPLLVSLGGDRVAYLDPTQPGRVLVVDEATGSSRELRIMAPRDRITREDLALAVAVEVRAKSSAQAVPRDSADACRVDETMQCLTFRHFLKGARLAPEFHPFATRARAGRADSGDPAIWIREGAPVGSDSVDWTAISTSRGVLGHLRLAASEELAPVSDSIVIVGRPRGSAGVSLFRVVLRPDEPRFVGRHFSTRTPAVLNPSWK